MMDLDSDCIGLVLDLLGPRSLVNLACTAVAFKRQVKKTKLMRWKLASKTNHKVKLAIACAPPPDGLSTAHFEFDSFDPVILAAYTGNLDILKLLCDGKGYAGAAVCAHAARGGHIETLIWASANGGVWSNWTLRLAADGGHLECFKYLLDNNCPSDSSTMGWAAAGGHLDIIKYAHERRLPWSHATCMWATKNGSLECLVFLHENGCPWGASTTWHAAVSGQLQCLTYAITNGCQTDTSICAAAAKAGHLDVLTYLKTQGCTWNSDTTRHAAENGHLDCLQFARENGCAWDSKMCAELAEYKNHKPVAKWVRARALIELSAGSRVRIYGLIGAARLNGSEGVVRSEDPSDGMRVLVEGVSPHGQILSVKRTNCLKI